MQIMVVVSVGFQILYFILLKMYFQENLIVQKW